MRQLNGLLGLGLGFGLALVILAGCAAPRTAPRTALSQGDRALLAVDLAHTRRAGLGPRFRPPAAGRTVAQGRPVGAWRCLPRRATAYGAHIELFAEGRGVLVPAGIGMSRRGRCMYPLRTADPTGLVWVGAFASLAPPRLGELFALWGQPLGRRRLGAFTGPVLAFLDGRRWRGDPREIPLHRHAQIVLELGGFVAPHAAYGFPAGL
jgi:hypothetical protein